MSGFYFTFIIYLLFVVGYMRCSLQLICQLRFLSLGFEHARSLWSLSYWSSCAVPSREFPTASRHRRWKFSRSLDFLKENVSLVIYPVTKSIWECAISMLKAERMDVKRENLF